MKLTYTGEHTGVLVVLPGGGIVEATNGEAVDLPDAIAENLLSDQPSNWQTTTNKANGKKSTATTEED